VVILLARGRDFPLLQSVKTCYGRIASGGEVDHPLPSRVKLGMSEFINPSHTFLDGMHRENFDFTFILPFFIFTFSLHFEILSFLLLITLFLLVKVQTSLIILF
jgi:hypothetical protein